MMGGHHAMTGAAAWIAVTATAGHGLGLFPVTPVGTIAGALLCAGAALLADADHNSATISQSVPLLGRLVTTGISRASGGHRHGLHSLLALLCAWLLASSIGFVLWQPDWADQPVSIGPALMSAAAIAFAAKALGLARDSWWLAWLIGFAVAAFIALFAPEQQAWFVVCFTLGYGVHLLGDLLTTGGLPLFWPWIPKPPSWWRRVPLLDSLWSSGGYLALPLLGNAGSLREWLLLIPVTVYAGYGIVFALLELAGINLHTVLLAVEAALPS
ncbi:MAG: metal-dependent hydrolase [Ramlibacter sp.]|nr:metal-dependent hydrolase [Cryobacterium sp.]